MMRSIRVPKYNALILLVAALAGCSAESWKKVGYEEAQYYRCENQNPDLSPDKQQARSLECWEGGSGPRQNEQSYEDYQAERDRILNDK